MVLHNIQQALCDLREANWIKPNNMKIVKELQKIESTYSQVKKKQRELHSQENDSKHADKWPYLEV